MNARSFVAFKESRPQVRLNFGRILVRGVKPDVHIPSKCPSFVLYDEGRMLIGQTPSQSDAIPDVLDQSVATFQTRVIVQRRPDLGTYLLGVLVNILV